MYKLIIQDDEGKTTVVPLIREELTIGRQEGNTIRLTERNVSRRHAKLLRGGSEIIIEDLDSYNGVRVNGSRIQGRAEIKEQDRVQIGDYLIEVKADQPNADAETREIAVIADPDAPEEVEANSSKASTVPTGVPVSTPPPVPSAPAPAPAPAAAKANGTGPMQAADVAASVVTPDEHANGRLVILSKTMAGREFVLDKPAMVIGRTEENDIWVNHRSISRHHAKVVRENGSYAIVDLQSANGVRVNGEEYGKVELRTRDVVDLGHVRFRFVAPNEDFLFGRDAQPVDIAVEGQRGKLMWGGVIILLLGVVGFLMFGGDGKKADPSAGSDTTQEPNTNDPPVVDDPPLVPAVVMDAAVEVAANPENQKQLATILKQAKASQDREAWSALAQAANKMLRLDANNAQAKEFAEQAALEKLNKVRFEKFHSALGKKSWSRAAAEYAKIDDESVYKVKARQDHDSAKAKFAKSQMAAVRKAAKAKKCSDIDRLVNNTPPEWSDIASDLRKVKCKEPSTRPPNNTNNNNTNNNNTNDKPPPNTANFATLLKQSQAAIKNTQFGKGLKFCKQALEIKPGDQDSLFACAIASCKLKNGAAARKFIRRVRSSQRRRGLVQICLVLKVPGFDEE